MNKELLEAKKAQIEQIFTQVSAEISTLRADIDDKRTQLETKLAQKLRLEGSHAAIVELHALPGPTAPVEGEVTEQPVSGVDLA